MMKLDIIGGAARMAALGKGILAADESRRGYRVEMEKDAA